MESYPPQKRTPARAALDAFLALPQAEIKRAINRGFAEIAIATYIASGQNSAAKRWRREVKEKATKDSHIVMRVWVSVTKHNDSNPRQLVLSCHTESMVVDYQN